jgi:hypothetical protein
VARELKEVEIKALMRELENMPGRRKGPETRKAIYRRNKLVIIHGFVPPVVFGGHLFMRWAFRPFFICGYGFKHAA